MNKPMILKVKDMEDEIVKLISESNLPIFVVEASINEIHRQLVSLKNQEIIEATKKYNETQKKEVAK